MKSLILILVLLCMANSADATDRYMATTGVNSGACTIGSPCLTLQYCFTQMTGGDTLYIADGEYTSAGNSIDQNHVPPSGSAGAYTVIRATNIPTTEALKVKFSGSAVFYEGSSYDDTAPPPPQVSYVKFEGIRWNGVTFGSGWTHNYFKQIASMGVQDGNYATFSISGRNNLFEDCVAFGKGRYKFLFYDQTRFVHSFGAGDNVCRRCVVRHDWSNKDGQAQEPMSAFSTYLSSGTAILNSIDIDSNIPAYWQTIPTEIGGSFYHPFPVINTTLMGSLALNNAYQLGHIYYPDGSASSGHIIKDVSGFNLAGGFSILGQTDASNILLHTANTANFTYRSTAQTNKVLTKDLGLHDWIGTSGATLYNSIVMGVATTGVKLATKDYLAMNGNGTNFDGTPAAHLYTGTQTASLKYPVRIETGSTLATAGSTGGPVGATILKRIGPDGAFKGDAGWNIEQSTDLWPWPLEGWVQAEMRTSDYAAFCAPYAGGATPCPSSYITDAQRGFASTTAKQLDGVSPVTLTSYIWESLGNQIPISIYGNTDINKPTTSTDKAQGRYTSSQIIALTCSDNEACATTKYCLGVDCTPATTYSSPFKVLQNIASQTYCVSSTDTADNVETAHCYDLRKQRRK